VKATLYLTIPGTNQLAFHDDKLITLRLWLLNLTPSIHSEFHKGVANWGNLQQDWLIFDAEIELSPSNWQRITALSEAQWKQLLIWLNEGSLLMQCQLKGDGYEVSDRVEN
jgi:hypothetical protein